jgi:hypothetical protein
MVIRAQGVAGSLDPMYIAKGLTDGSSEVIYVPVELQPVDLRKV